MKRIQLLLAVRPKLFGESLREVLQRELDIDVVGVVREPVDVFVAIRRKRPDVVVHSWADVSRTPWFYSLWLDEHPGLVIVSVSENLLRVFRGVDTAQSATTNEVPSLLRVVRRLFIERPGDNASPKQQGRTAGEPEQAPAADEPTSSKKTTRLLFGGWASKERPFSGR